MFMFFLFKHSESLWDSNPHPVGCCSTLKRSVHYRRGIDIKAAHRHPSHWTTLGGGTRFYCLLINIIRSPMVLWGINCSSIKTHRDLITLSHWAGNDSSCVYWFTLQRKQDGDEEVCSSSSARLQHSFTSCLFCFLSYWLYRLCFLFTYVGHILNLCNDHKDVIQNA